MELEEFSILVKIDQVKNRLLLADFDEAQSQAMAEYAVLNDII